jgi:hypothetical protein
MLFSSNIRSFLRKGKLSNAGPHHENGKAHRHLDRGRERTIEMAALAKVQAGT